MTELIAPAAAPATGGIHADWFSRLRTGLFTGQVLVIALSQGFLPIQLPLGALLAVVGLLLLSNLALTIWRRDHAPTPGLLFSVMVVDVAALTAMLYLTGGPTNPFSSLYLVYVAWAAVVLPARVAWALATLAFGGFGLLFFEHRPLEMTQAMDHHHGHMWHLQGMWWSLGLAAVLIVYFVQRLTRALAARDAELARLETSRRKADRLAGLATLAAGAAHELATPLSTIAVVAKELERSLEREGGHEAAADDARLVRTQVDRCRHILEQMSADAGEAAGEAPTPLTADGLAAAVLEKIADPERARVEVSATAGLDLGRWPRRALARGVRGLVRNGLHAGEGPVRLEVGIEGREVVVRVTDRGAGMDEAALARIGEPFHTTKPPGQGMGLGVFLMRTLAERLGGSLGYTSKPGEGTCATLRLPLAPARRSVA